MHNTNLSFKVISIVLGSATGLAVFASTSKAVPTSALNPCPGIYYEEPHNSLRTVPEGCPANAKGRLLAEQGQLPNIQESMPILSSENQVMPNQAPLPEQQAVITTITPRMGLVDVSLKNETNAPITYQAIGHTQQRSLSGKEEVVLQGLPVPLSVTFLRPDGGLVKVIPIESAEPGVLVLRLDGANGLTDSQTTVRVQTTGKVSAY
jgi:hypothetical protein